jgi:hypothetical protein
MWILKGAFLGAWLFGFGTIFFLYFAVYRDLPPNTAVATNLITRFTSENPLLWASLACCIVLGCALLVLFPS